MKRIILIKAIEESGDWAKNAFSDQKQYLDLMYQSGYKSAYYWCDKESRKQGVNGIEVFQHYINRLSQRGWGQFTLLNIDVKTGQAEIKLEYSSFVLAEPIKPGKLCHMFSGWFSGAMDWVLQKPGSTVCTACAEAEPFCMSKHHQHCIFTVHPISG